ncbi:MAG: PAS domain S-box protein, partial [Gammaproteobacteria bacterium]|nr:PAS domain S-box protein [Gammaproteobacteria bacterium]
MNHQPYSLRVRVLLLMLAAALPAATALAYVVLRLPVGTLEQPVLLFPVLATALILALGWMIGAAFLLDTLQPVISTVQRVADGDLSARTRPQQAFDDETSKLAHEVDRMAEALSRRDQALTEARDRANAYLEIVGVMVIALNSKGNIALANRKACEVLGCGALHQCVGSNWFDKWLPGEDREQARAVFSSHLASEPPGEFQESQVLTASGQRRLIAWHHTPISDKSGRVIGILSAGEDITEARRTQQALLDSSNRYQALVDNIPGVVYRCAIAYPWQMEFISRQIEQITGIAAERFLDHSVRYGELVHPDDLGRLEQVVAEGIDYRHAYTCAYRIRRNGGTWRWVHEQGQAIRDGEDRPAWLDGVIVDITENKALQQEQERLQAQLQQAQKMEALGQLTGGIAHDFNNILSAVLGFTKLALRRHVPDPNSELAEYLREVVTAGERARDLVARMLTFSRSQPGRLAQPLAAQPLIREALKMLTATIPAGIRIDAQIDSKAPDIAIDPVDLHQILINLVINARDTLDGKGNISVSLAPRRLEQQVCFACHEKFSGDYVALRVADDGQGIAAETLPHIFEPFFTTKPISKGTGMGLSMVHGLVHRADGHFQVESRVGQGSAFHIFLPVALPGGGEAAPAQTTPLGTAFDKPKGHVLIVDDESAILKLLRNCLESEGWRVSGFTSPRQALAVFRDAPDEFAAIISDQTMPGMGGGDLIRAIHALRPR